MAREGELLLPSHYGDRGLWQTSPSQRSLRWHAPCSPEDALDLEKQKTNFEQDFINIFSAFRRAYESQSGICIRCLSVYWHIDRADEGRSLVSSSSDSLHPLEHLLLLLSHPSPDTWLPSAKLSPLGAGEVATPALSLQSVCRAVSSDLVTCAVPRPPWRPWDKAARLWGPTKVTWFPSWGKIQGSSDPVLCR